MRPARRPAASLCGRGRVHGWTFVSPDHGPGQMALGFFRCGRTKTEFARLKVRLTHRWIKADRFLKPCDGLAVAAGAAHGVATREGYGGGLRSGARKGHRPRRLPFSLIRTQAATDAAVACTLYRVAGAAGPVSRAGYFCFVSIRGDPVVAGGSVAHAAVPPVDRAVEPLQSQLRLFSAAP